MRNDTLKLKTEARPPPSERLGPSVAHAPIGHSDRLAIAPIVALGLTKP